MHIKAACSLLETDIGAKARGLDETKCRLKESHRHIKQIQAFAQKKYYMLLPKLPIVIALSLCLTKLGANWTFHSAGQGRLLLVKRFLTPAETGQPWGVFFLSLRLSGDILATPQLSYPAAIPRPSFPWLGQSREYNHDSLNINPKSARIDRSKWDLTHFHQRSSKLS